MFEHVWEVHVEGGGNAKICHMSMCVQNTCTMRKILG